MAAADKRLLWQGVPNIDFAFSGSFPPPNDKTKIMSVMNVTNAHGSTFASANLAANIAAEIGRRGNTTAGFPKAAINVKTVDGAGKKLKKPLLGMPTGSGWSLLAEVQDATHVRTLFGHRLSWCLGLPWASRTAKITVSHNGVTQGLFTLCEKVEDGADRIAITAGEEGDDPATVDFVMEQLPLSQVDVAGGEKPYTDIRGNTWIAKVPDPDEIADDHLAYCGGKIDAFFAAVYAENWALVETLIDTRSFAQFFLLQDILKNMDADISSWYFTIRSGKIYAGPGWDWNGIWPTIASAPYTGMPTDFTDPNDTYLPLKADWYGLMMDEWPAFRAEVVDVFTEALPDIHRLFQDLRDYVPQLVATGLIEADRTQWPDLLSDPTYNFLPTYAAEYARADKFISDRLFYHTRRLYLPIPAKPIMAGA